MNSGLTVSTSTKCKRYALYTCCDSSAQLKGQELRCRAFATAPGWNIFEEYVYADTGLEDSRTVDRIWLDRLVAAAAPKKFDSVFFNDINAKAVVRSWRSSPGQPWQCD